MPERKIDPKFNIHETYTRVNIVNPYRFGGGGGASYEPETTAYIDRIQADGGIVVDPDWVDLIYKTLKAQNRLSDLRVWTSANAGVKVSSNYISKLYSLDLNNNDISQPTSAYQPLYTDSIINANRKSVVYNGSAMFNTLIAFSSRIYTMIDLSVFHSMNSRMMQHGLRVGTGFPYNAVGIEFWNDGREVVYNGNGSTFQQRDFTGSKAINTYYLSTIRRRLPQVGTLDEIVYTTNSGQSLTTIGDGSVVDVNSYLIGARSTNGTGNPMKGEINENVCFSVNLTDAQEAELRNMINTYY